MPIWIALVLQASQQATFDLAHVQRGASGSAPLIATPCQSGSDGAEIVVCGQKRDHYRLPLPVERGQQGDRARGDVPNGIAAITPAAPCGIFAGERRCNKREAAQYGYGDERDPFTVLAELAKRAADSDDH